MAEKPTNHGEGDPEAAAEFNAAEQAFVASRPGRAAIEEGTHVPPDEQAELDNAERIGRERSKGEDPLVSRRPNR